MNKAAALIATEIIVNIEFFQQAQNGYVKKTIWQHYGEDGKPALIQAKKTNINEKLISEIITAATRGRSQKGDVSQSLAEQGFFDGGAKPKGLAERDPQVSGGNPIDVKKKFFEQNPK
jgi:hypothetical protein